MTSVPPDQFDFVVRSLDERSIWGLNRYSRPNYIRQRFEVESLMHAKFIEKGGKPVLSHPIYFFLGRNKRFEEHPLNVGYIIDLASIAKDSISFSYGDTMLSFNEENRKLAGEPYKNSLCNSLYMIDEIEALLENKLFPNKNALNIEAHLWTQPTNEIVRRLSR